MKENPVLQETVTKLTMLNSFKCVTLALWDEEREKLIDFAAAAEFLRRSRVRVTA